MRGGKPTCAEERFGDLCETNQRFHAEVLDLFGKQLAAVEGRVRMLEELFELREAPLGPEFSFCERDGSELLRRLDAVIEAAGERVHHLAAQSSQLREIHSTLLGLNKKCASVAQLQPAARPAADG